MNNIVLKVTKVKRKGATSSPRRQCPSTKFYVCSVLLLFAVLFVYKAQGSETTNAAQEPQAAATTAEAPVAQTSPPATPETSDTGFSVAPGSLGYRGSEEDTGPKLTEEEHQAKINYLTKGLFKRMQRQADILKRYKPAPEETNDQAEDISMDVESFDLFAEVDAPNAGNFKLLVHEFLRDHNEYQGQDATNPVPEHHSRSLLSVLEDQAPASELRRVFVDGTLKPVIKDLSASASIKSEGAKPGFTFKTLEGKPTLLEAKVSRTVFVPSVDEQAAFKPVLDSSSNEKSVPGIANMEITAVENLSWKVQCGIIASALLITSMVFAVFAHLVLYITSEPHAFYFLSKYRPAPGIEFVDLEVGNGSSGRKGHQSGILRTQLLTPMYQYLEVGDYEKISKAGAKGSAALTEVVFADASMEKTGLAVVIPKETDCASSGTLSPIRPATLSSDILSPTKKPFGSMKQDGMRLQYSRLFDQII